MMMMPTPPPPVSAEDEVVTVGSAHKKNSKKIKEKLALKTPKEGGKEKMRSPTARMGNEKSARATAVPPLRGVEEAPSA